MSEDAWTQNCCNFQSDTLTTRLDLIQECDETNKSVSLPFKGTQDWDFFWLWFWNLYYFFISYVKIYLQTKFFDQAIIGEDTIFPLSLRLSGIEFSLVWDLGESILA